MERGGKGRRGKKRVRVEREGEERRGKMRDVETMEEKMKFQYN